MIGDRRPKMAVVIGWIGFQRQTRDQGFSILAIFQTAILFSGLVRFGRKPNVVTPSSIATM